MNNTYTKKERNRYLLGLSGQNILYGIITSSLAYFMQFTILIPAVWVGIILCVCRIFDAVKDPIIGAMMNNGKRQIKDYLLILPIPTAIMTVMCYVNGVYSADNSSAKNAVIIASAFISYLLWEIVYTIGDIPITGYPSLMTKVDSDRTRLLSLRPIGSLVCSISILLMQPTAFALSKKFGSSALDERNGFLTSAIIFSVIGGTLYQITAIGSTQRVQAVNADDTRQIHFLFSNPILRKILTSGILGCLKSMPGIVLTPIITYYFAGKDPTLSFIYTFLFGVGSFIGMIVSMIFVPNLTEKYGKAKILIYSNMLNVIPNLLLFFIYLKNPQTMNTKMNLTLMFLLSLIIGSLISISTTVQTLIISDAVELEEQRSGNRPTALFFSCQTAMIKIGTGISSLAVSIGYSVINFTSESALALNEFVANGGVPRLENEFENLMTALFFLYTVPVAISSLLSALPFIKRKK